MESEGDEGEGVSEVEIPEMDAESSIQYVPNYDSGLSDCLGGSCSWNVSMCDFIAGSDGVVVAKISGMTGPVYHDCDRHYAHTANIWTVELISSFGDSRYGDGSRVELVHLYGYGRPFAYHNQREVGEIVLASVRESSGEFFVLSSVELNVDGVATSTWVNGPDHYDFPNRYGPLSDLARASYESSCHMGDGWLDDDSFDASVRVPREACLAEEGGRE